MKLRNLKSWLNNYLEGNCLYHLFYLGVIATCLDLGSTWLALGMWPNVFIESYALPASMMKLMGLTQAIILLWCLRVTIGYLLWKSTCRRRIRFIGLLSIIVGGFYYGVSNCYYIVYILLI